MLDAEDLLADFTPPQLYTMEAAASAPCSPGVHVVLDRGAILYVGSTGDLRRRLRQHLTGNRGSSVLHDQIGQLLDDPGKAASAANIAGWLGRREVRWQATDNPKVMKDALVLALRPYFNRQVPKPQ
ncbi:GIY-YIG nuclease family protein [Micromonospora sp. SL4-19]|uniref:GIY-YIG nuclease family protein n=1 Tax=Micromonospora sp. SL4-19 TaxID=3399129 RepID=UPI003A4D51CF